MTHLAVHDRPRSKYALWLVAGLLVTSVVSWRRGQYYAGGVDPVVVGKAGLDVIAMLVASVHSFVARRRRYLRGTATVWFLVTYVMITVFGAIYTGSTLLASVVLAARLIVIAVACFQLLRDYLAVDILRALLAWMGLVALAAVISGLVSPLGAAVSDRGSISAVWSVLTSSRLSGQLPPLGPNEIGELAGFVVIGLAWLLVQGRAGRWAGPTAAGFVGLLYLSGSRTGLVALGLAVVFMLLLSRRLPVWIVVSLYAVVPMVVYLTFATGSLRRFFARGGSANLSTLNNRSVAWNAALDLHHGFWPSWFGNGMSQLLVPVSVRFRSEQILDSSWVSALVQGGFLGVLVLAAWLLYGMWVSVRSPWPFRLLGSGLMVFIGLRTFLESGLPGATPAFLIFFVLCVAGGGLTMARGDSLIEAELLPAHRRATPVPVG